jgi:hypothetical protein
LELVESRASLKEVTASWTIGVRESGPTSQIERSLTMGASLDGRMIACVFYAIHGIQRGIERLKRNSLFHPCAI